MIPELMIREWQHQQAPWSTLSMVEQDLVISRVLVDLYNQPAIKESLIFRGGTALNKIYLNPPTRYSEDLDFVQIKPEPIGNIINAIRRSLDPWLGEPKRKFTDRSVKLTYRFDSIDELSARLKIEINTTEHFHIYDFKEIGFKMRSDWYNGDSIIKTYQLNEMMGTKLRALYQRRKGRDLFDLWYVLKEKLADPSEILFVFTQHNEFNQQIVTRAMFEKSLYEKQQNQDFINDMNVLLHPHIKYDAIDALELIRDVLVTKLPGQPWLAEHKEKHT